MPKYKNHFASPAFIEEKILDNDDKAVGTIRIKPVSISWKPRGKGQFLSVKLDDFVAWITDPKTKAKKTNS